MKYTEDDFREMAVLAADELVESAREGNRLLALKTGQPSRASEADYQDARDRIERELLSLADLTPRGG